MEEKEDDNYYDTQGKSINLNTRLELTHTMFTVLSEISLCIKVR